MTPLRVLKPPRPARKRVHPGTCEVSQTNTRSGVVRILHFRDSSKISDELPMAPCFVWRHQSPTEMQRSASYAKLRQIQHPLWRPAPGAANEPEDPKSNPHVFTALLGPEAACKSESPRSKPYAFATLLGPVAACKSENPRSNSYVLTALQGPEAACKSQNPRSKTYVFKTLLGPEAACKTENRKSEPYVFITLLSSRATCNSEIRNAKPSMCWHWLL